jgi:hypothetical protein
VPIKSEHYRGCEIELRKMGPAPWTSRVRFPWSGIFEPETRGQSEDEVRMKVRQIIDDRLSKKP